MLVELSLERIAVVLDQLGQSFAVSLNRTAVADVLAPLSSARLGHIHLVTVTPMSLVWNLGLRPVVSDRG